jgi:hypothetical protein
MPNDNFKAIIFSLKDGSFIDWYRLISSSSFTELNCQKLISGLDDSGDEDDEPSTYRINGPSLRLEYKHFCLIIAVYFLKRNKDEEASISIEDKFRMFIHRIGEKFGRIWDKAKWNAVIDDIIRLGYLNNKCLITNNFIRIGNVLVH